MTNKFWKKEWFIQISIFLGVFFVHQIINLTIVSPWAMGDELGTLASGAYFAGYDWRSVMQSPSNYGSGVNYYGGGFGVIFTPLFLLIRNRPYFLYQCILSVCAVLQSIPAVLSYRMLKSHFGIENLKCRIFIAISSSFFVMSRATNAMNESMLIFCVWVVCYLFLAFTHKKGYERGLYKYCVGIGIILAYTYTVHTRSIIFIATVVLLMVITCVIEKHYKVLGLFLVSFSCFILLAKIFNSYILEKVFLQSSSAPVYNTADAAASSVVGQLIQLFFDKQWHAWGDIFITNVFGFLTVSLLMFGIATIIWIKKVIKICRLKEKVDAFFFIGFLSLIPTWGMLGLYSVHGLGNTIEAINEGICTRAHFYLRYAGAFIGPITVLVGVIIWKQMLKINEVICSILVYIIGGGYIVWSILPRLEGRNDQQMDFFHFFSPFNGMKYGTFFHKENFEVLCLTMFFILAVFSGLWKYKKKIMLAFLFSLIVLYQYVYIALEYDRVSAKDLHDKTWSAIELLSNNEKIQKEITTLYLPLISGRWETPYVLQYYLPDVEIIKEIPEDKEKIVMLVYKELQSQYLGETEFYFTTLNGGIYLYVSEDILEVFEGENLKFNYANR